MLEEVEVSCPACWESIAFTVDLSGGSASFTEDCPVCCRPMQVWLEVQADGKWQVDVGAENE